MENSSYIKPYFYIDDNKVIYPSATWKRIGARFLDIFLVQIFILIVFTILYTSNISYWKISGDMSGELFSDYIPPLYSLPFMLTVSIGIFFLILFNLIIPLITKKNSGQTFGKIVFGITPIFFTPGNKKIIVARELPITIIVVTPLIILLIMGGNPSFYYHQIQEFVKNGGTIDGLTNNEGEIIVDGTGKELTIYYFVNYFMTNESIMGNSALTQTAASFIYVKQVFAGIYWIFLIVLFLSIAFNHQKMGIIDKLVNTSVVDLKTIIDRSLIEGDPNYQPDNTLDPKDTSSNDGPPVELNKK